jgi:hypothetical protein
MKAALGPPETKIASTLLLSISKHIHLCHQCNPCSSLSSLLSTSTSAIMDMLAQPYTAVCEGVSETKSLPHVASPQM